MERVLTESIAFNPSLRTLDFANVANFNFICIKSIVNETAGVTLFAPAFGSQLSATVVGTVVTLNSTCSGMNSGDKIRIVYDENLGATAALQSTQISKLDSVISLISSQNAALVSQAVSSLQSQQLAVLNSIQISSLQTEQIASLAAIKNSVAALSSQATAALQSQQIAILNSIQVSSLQTEQISALTAIKTSVAALTSQATAALQSQQLTALTNLEIAAATQTQQLQELVDNSVAPLAVQPPGTTFGTPTREINPKITRHNFSDSGSGLLSSDFSQLVLGSGMAVSQQYGYLLVTSGTTVNSEFLAKSVANVKGACIFRWRDLMSQRILNSSMAVSLADSLGDGLAFTSDATGKQLTVTFPLTNPFTSAKIGQYVKLGDFVGLATPPPPGRYAITAVSGLDVTFARISNCTWTRSTTTATATLLGGGWGPVYIAQTTADVTSSSDVAAITNGNKTLATQSSTAGFGNVVTFTCLNAGAASGTLVLQDAITWTANGSGTLSMYGWNSIELSYHQASNTTAWFECYKNGWSIGATAITVNGSAAGQITSIQTDGSLVDVTTFNNTTNTAYAGTPRGTRLELVPAEDVVLYTYISVFNGTTAPASSTNCQYGFGTIEETGNQKVQIVGNVANGVTRGNKVSVNDLPTLGTVTTITNAQVSLPVAVADQASGAITTTTTSGTITPATGAAFSVNIPVTAVSGTNPTMDTVVQESKDSGTNWQDLYHFPRITATGFYSSPPLTLTGNRVRYVQTIGGTTPSFTRSINRLQNSIYCIPARLYFDRTANALNGTASTPTASYIVEGCSVITAKILLGAATVAATYQIQISDDNSSWANVGTATLAVANSLTTFSVSGISAKFARVIVTGAATSQTGTYIAISAQAA